MNLHLCCLVNNFKDARCVFLKNNKCSYVLAKLQNLIVSFLYPVRMGYFLHSPGTFNDTTVSILPRSLKFLDLVNNRINLHKLRASDSDHDLIRQQRQERKEMVEKAEVNIRR